MIPLVLGGIALAVVGYGVKEYCEEEGCPWDEKVSCTPSLPTKVTLSSLHEIKTSLHDDKLLKLRVQLLKIEQSDDNLRFKDTVNMHKEALVYSELEDDVKVYMSRYKKLLDKSSDLIDVYADGIETLMEENTQYESYTKTEKKLVKKAYKIVNMTQKLLGLRLLEGKVLNVEMIKPLKELEVKIENFKIDADKRQVMGVGVMFA